jgi:mercuric ion transport protein
MLSLLTGRDPAVPGASPAGARSAAALWLAGLAALLASACCVLPLVFVLVGVSGAWIAQLTLLQPYSLWLEGLALLALGLAAWRIYRPVPRSAAGPGEPCGPACAVARPAVRAWFWLVASLALLPIVVTTAAPLFY